MKKTENLGKKMITLLRKPLMFVVSLGREAHQYASDFSQNHTSFDKQEQVFFNTLAVYAVNNYLQCMNIETDLKASDSWDVVRQTLGDVADLEVKNKGKLECRYVIPGDDFVFIPQELQANRIGYVPVEINEEMSEAKLLGFIDKVTKEYFPLSQLRQLDDLPKYLTSFS